MLKLCILFTSIFKLNFIQRLIFYFQNSETIPSCLKTPSIYNSQFYNIAMMVSVERVTVYEYHIACILVSSMDHSIIHQVNNNLHYNH